MRMIPGLPSRPVYLSNHHRPHPAHPAHPAHGVRHPHPHPAYPAHADKPWKVRTVFPPQIMRLQEGQTATYIPSGMNGIATAAAHSAASDVIAKLVAAGISRERAVRIVGRAHGRARRRHAHRNVGLSGLGDVVGDATTWITYGNDIVNRSKTGNVGEEAMKAAQNVNTFLAHRGDELQAASPETLDALGEVTDRLTKIASGQIKYDSVAGAFVDEFGNAVRGEVIVGTQAVLAAPKKIVKFLGDEVVKPALDIVPWYVWAGGLAIGGGLLWSQAKR